MALESDMIKAAGEYKIEVKTVEYDSGVKMIGVVSDTHIPTRGRFLPPQLFMLFAGVQLILHAGDLVDEKVIDELQTLAPVEAVAGNMDPLRLNRLLGRLKLVKVGGINIGLLHGDIGSRRVSFSQVSKLFKPARLQAVVFGHLHEPLVKMHEGTLYFNPGSAVDPRREPKPSCGRLLIDGSEISGEIFYL
jgi:uncharacterized protein